MTRRQTALLAGGLALLGATVAFALWWSPASEPPDAPVERAPESPRFAEPPVLDVPDRSTPPAPDRAVPGERAEEAAPVENATSAHPPGDMPPPPDLPPAEDALQERAAEEPFRDDELITRREQGLELLDTTLARLRREMAAQQAAGDEAAATRSRTRIERMTVVRATRAQELEAMRAGTAE